MRRLQDLGTKLYKDNHQVEFPVFKIIQISKASTEESQGTDSGHVFMSSTYRVIFVPLNKTAIQNAGNILLFVVSKTVNNECCTRGIFRYRRALSKSWLNVWHTEKFSNKKCTNATCNKDKILEERPSRQTDRTRRQKGYRLSSYANI